MADSDRDRRRCESRDGSSSGDHLDRDLCANAVARPHRNRNGTQRFHRRRRTIAISSLATRAHLRRRRITRHHRLRSQWWRDRNGGRIGVDPRAVRFPSQQDPTRPRGQSPRLGQSASTRFLMSSSMRISFGYGRSKPFSPGHLCVQSNPIFPPKPICCAAWSS